MSDRIDEACEVLHNRRAEMTGEPLWANLGTDQRVATRRGVVALLDHLGLAPDLERLTGPIAKPCPWCMAPVGAECWNATAGHQLGKTGRGVRFHHSRSA